MPASIEKPLSSPRGRRAWRITAANVSAVDSQLTGRDRRILRLLDEHFTFTTSRLALLAGFSSLSTASHRLLLLHQRDVLERARPFRAGGGSFEWHWMLGPIGARLVAAERGVTPIRPAKVVARWEKLFNGWRYRELDAQHAWFCGLISAVSDQHDAAGELAAWRSAWRVGRDWQATTDGYGRWHWSDGTELRFVLLLDDPPRVGARQIRERLASLPDPAWAFTHRAGFTDDTVTLIWTATLRREQVMRRAIVRHLGGDTRRPVALGCAEYAACVPGGVHGRAWLPLGALGRRKSGRRTLHELALAAEAGIPRGSTQNGWEE